MRVFGIDPGSERTGYGCVDTDGRRHQLVTCGAITVPARASFPERLRIIHSRLAELIVGCHPDSVAIENLFHANNVRSALKLGHARGVAMLAAVEAGVSLVEYTPAEIKRAVVGYGRAEKPQVQQMVKLLLGLSAAPSPHDAADALAVAICHVHHHTYTRLTGTARRSGPKSWRQVRLEDLRSTPNSPASARTPSSATARPRQSSWPGNGPTSDGGQLPTPKPTPKAESPKPKVSR